MRKIADVQNAMLIRQRIAKGGPGSGRYPAGSGGGKSDYRSDQQRRTSINQEVGPKGKGAAGFEEPKKMSDGKLKSYRDAFVSRFKREYTPSKGIHDLPSGHDYTIDFRHIKAIEGELKSRGIKHKQTAE